MPRDRAPRSSVPVQRAPSLRALIRKGSDLLSKARGRGGSGDRGSDRGLSRGSSAVLVHQEDEEVVGVRPDAYMPGEVVVDWTYRVCDHRKQGGPLVPAHPPPSLGVPPVQVAPSMASVAGGVGGGGGGCGGSGSTNSNSLMEGSRVLPAPDAAGRGSAKEATSHKSQNVTPVVVPGGAPEAETGADEKDMSAKNLEDATEQTVAMAQDRPKESVALTPLLAAARATAADDSHRNDGMRSEEPVAIAAGWRHSVAVTSAGAVFVWGCGGNGRLGLGAHVDVQKPQQVRMVVVAVDW